MECKRGSVLLYNRFNQGNKGNGGIEKKMNLIDRVNFLIVISFGSCGGIKNKKALP